MTAKNSDDKKIYNGNDEEYQYFFVKLPITEKAKTIVDDVSDFMVELTSELEGKITGEIIGTFQLLDKQQARFVIKEVFKQLKGEVA